MIGGGRGSWLTIVADLSLILFMVTAAAMGREPEKNVENPLAARTEPTAVYRPYAGSPSLSEWLANQAPDDRQRVTIVAQVPDGQLDGASQAALDLAQQARAAGFAPRISLEPAEAADLAVVLAYDGSGNWHDDCTVADTPRAGRAPQEDETCD